MNKQVIFSVALLCIVLANSLSVSAARNYWDLYHSKDGAIQMWKDLVNDHPGQASSEVIGKSLQGKDIYLFKIGSSSGGRVMMDGSIHGAEDSGTELTFEFAKWVLESNDPRAQTILKSNYLLFIPVINIDSSVRQNMRRSYTLSNGSTLSVKYGVDLNRNFPYGWGDKGSPDPNDNLDYRGLYAGSEPETQAVMNAIKKYRPKIYLNIHHGDDEYSWWRGQKALSQDIVTRTGNLAKQAGVTPYGMKEGAGFGGYVQAYAYSYNASAWLIEICHWDVLPETREGLISKYYTRIFPMMLAMAQSVQANQPETCTPNWVLGSWKNCTTKDIQYRYYYDSNGCGDDSTKPKPEARSCNYCTPSWTEKRSNCGTNNKTWVTYTYTNSCCASTGLASDCNIPANHSEACVYGCTPIVVNSSWSDWTAQSCRTDDTTTEIRTKKQYDKNNCGIISEYVFTDKRAATCDYCLPDWTAKTSACTPSSTQTITYEDANSCCQLTKLDSDCTKPSEATKYCQYRSSSGSGGGGGGSSAKTTTSNQTKNNTAPKIVVNLTQAKTESQEPVLQQIAQEAMEIPQEITQIARATVTVVDNVRRKLTIQMLILTAVLAWLGVFAHRMVKKHAPKTSRKSKKR